MMAAPKRASGDRLVLQLCLRALALAVLGYFIVHLLVRTQLYATSIVLALAASVIVFDTVLVVRRFERTLESATHLGRSDQPLTATARRLHASLTLQTQPTEELLLRTQQQHTRLEALLDTLSTPLLVLRDDGSIECLNQAAHKLGPQVRLLEELPLIGRRAAETIASMPPGSRQIVTGANGRSLLISVSLLTLAGEPVQRLIAIQTVATELAAVEVKAWHDMARVLTHEMMNSLTPIASLSESLEQLARQELPDDAARAGELADALEAIKRRSRGLMSFVERYRALAHLPEPNLQPLSMRALLQSIESLLSRPLQERGIQASWRMATGPLELRADRELLEQALINLVHNAADAAAQAPRPCIEIVCERRPSELVVQVRDNGPGLAEHARDQVFVPFYSTKPHGSGIGLSIARHAALVHGGQLSVRDNEPSGCVFELRLTSLGV